MRSSVVVIGSGLAGSLLSNELARGADVTVLEIGEKDRIHYPSISFDGRELAHVATFCHGGGGTTNLWHNGLMPIGLQDVTGQAFRDVLSDSRRFIDDAAARLFFKGRYTDAYQAAVRDATASADLAGITGDGIDCLIYPKRFEPLTVDSAVRAFYAVDDIGFVMAGGRVRAVRFKSRGTWHSVDTSQVIVAAGTMGSPKMLRDILTASGHRFDRLGRGFIDHPIGFVGKVRFRKEAADAVSELSLKDKGDYLVCSAIRLKSPCGRYTCCAFLRPAATMENNLAIYKYKSFLGATRGLTRFGHALSAKLFHPDILAEVVSHVFGVQLPGRTYNVLLIAEQRRGDNRVYYDGNDLRVDWTISNEEIAAYRLILQQLCDLLAPVAEAVNIETALTEDWLWSAAHHSGTTPLGAGADDLVDRNLRLNVCENVYVCDGSIIQEHSYANTGLTIGQLALRLARHLSAAPEATGRPADLGYAPAG